MSVVQGMDTVAILDDLYYGIINNIVNAIRDYGGIIYGGMVKSQVTARDIDVKVKSLHHIMLILDAILHELQSVGLDASVRSLPVHEAMIKPHKLGDAEWSRVYKSAIKVKSVTGAETNLNIDFVIAPIIFSPTIADRFAGHTNFPFNTFAVSEEMERLPYHCLLSGLINMGYNQEKLGDIDRRDGGMLRECTGLTVHEIHYTDDDVSNGAFDPLDSRSCNVVAKTGGGLFMCDNIFGTVRWIANRWMDPGLADGDMSRGVSTRFASVLEKIDNGAILTIDDVRIVRMSLREMCEYEGYDAIRMNYHDKGFDTRCPLLFDVNALALRRLLVRERNSIRFDNQCRPINKACFLASQSRGLKLYLSEVIYSIFYPAIPERSRVRVGSRGAISIRIALYILESMAPGEFEYIETSWTTTNSTFKSSMYHWLGIADKDGDLTLKMLRGAVRANPNIPVGDMRKSYDWFTNHVADTFSRTEDPAYYMGSQPVIRMLDRFRDFPERHFGCGSSPDNMSQSDADVYVRDVLNHGFHRTDMASLNTMDLDGYFSTMSLHAMLSLYLRHYEKEKGISDIKPYWETMVLETKKVFGSPIDETRCHERYSLHPQAISPSDDGTRRSLENEVCVVCSVPIIGSDSYTSNILKFTNILTLLPESLLSVIGEFLVEDKSLDVSEYGEKGCWGNDKFRKTELRYIRRLAFENTHHIVVGGCGCYAHIGCMCMQYDDSNSTALAYLQTSYEDGGAYIRKHTGLVCKCKFSFTTGVRVSNDEYENWPHLGQCTDSEMSGSQY